MTGAPALPARQEFPQDFVFGTATSAYQIEGQRSGGAGASHWDAFAQLPGAISDGTSGDVACDHYHRYEQDLDLAGPFDAYRFSINWSRVLPEGRGRANPEGLAFYDRLVDAMLARGLKPFATLYHWDLPQALSQKGGWSRRDIAGWFGDFAETVMRRLGDRVESVATINEPMCVSWLGHFEGIHAPGQRDLATAARAHHNVLLAHAEAMTRLRGMGIDNLGIALNFEAIAPASGHKGDLRAAAVRDAIANRWFIEAICHGTYPRLALEGLEPLLEPGWQDDLAQISQPIDWLGVNYYTRNTIAAAPGKPWPGYGQAPAPLPRTDMGWEIYPRGLHDLLVRLATEHVGSLPVVVTENGMANKDRPEGGQVHDPARIAYMDQHLRAALAAIGDGVNLKGFFCWSLLDNFEWSHGYEKRFGLVHVDYKTQLRTPKSSYQTYKAAYKKAQ